MPKAARARGASPPAGTALARTIRDCLPNRVRIGRDSLYVTEMGTKVNCCHLESDRLKSQRGSFTLENRHRIASGIPEEI